MPEPLTPLSLVCEPERATPGGAPAALVCFLRALAAVGEPEPAPLFEEPCSAPALEVPRASTVGPDCPARTVAVGAPPGTLELPRVVIDGPVRSCTPGEPPLELVPPAPGAEARGGMAICSACCGAESEAGEVDPALGSDVLARSSAERSPPEPLS